MTTISNQTLRTDNDTQKRSNGPKPNSKKSQLIKLLSRKSGVDVPTLSAKLGWQPHTTRAALSGLRKTGFTVAKETSGIGKPARYRILPAPAQNDVDARDVA